MTRTVEDYDVGYGEYQIALDPLIPDLIKFGGFTSTCNKAGSICDLKLSLNTT